MFWNIKERPRWSEAMMAGRWGWVPEGLWGHYKEFGFYSARAERF